MTFPAFTGSGSPEGVQVGAVGQYYENTDDGSLYAKVDDDGMDTGWLGPLIVAQLNEFAVADNQTTIDCDDVQVDLDWIVAAPPNWADNAGNIIAPGLYRFDLLVAALVSPTVPGVWVKFSGMYGAGFFALDGLEYATNATCSFTVGLGPTNVPLAVTGAIQAQTDATGQLDAAIRVARLAYNVP